MVEPDDAAAAEPRIVGRYALFDEIAAGGMATIHLGRLVGSVGFSRTVAIKTLHPQFAKDPDFVEMFLEEARLASRIQHPNVISTVDVAEADEGEVFLVMEYVAGESLAKLVRASLKQGLPVPTNVAVSVLAGTLHGLHATHEAKNENLEPMHIVHRDVSPQNILVGLDGVARIFDFGVAKAAAMRSQATAEGQMKGKLSYMSPEQLNSRSVDRRTDVFAAGVVAWECIAGKRLFSGSDPGEVLAKVLTLDIQAPRQLRPEVPEALSAVIMKSLERDPDHRWQTARDFAVALEQTANLAPTHVVGEWVVANASDALRDRQRRVESVERNSLRMRGASIVPPAPQPRSAAPRAHPSEATTARPLREHAGTVGASVLNPPPPAGAGESRQGWAYALMGTVLAALVGGGIWYQSTPRPTRRPTITPVDELYRGGGRDTAPSVTQRAAASPSEPPEVSYALKKQTLEEGEGSGSARGEVEGPGGGRESEEGEAAAREQSAPSAPPRARGSRSKARARSSRGRARRPTKKRARRKSKRVVGQSPDTAPAKAPSEALARESKSPPAPAASASAAGCTPPFVVDESGIKRLKPQCL